jgi:hypothetical protein
VHLGKDPAPSVRAIVVVVFLEAMDRTHPVALPRDCRRGRLQFALLKLESRLDLTAFIPATIAVVETGFVFLIYVSLSPGI